MRVTMESTLGPAGAKHPNWALLRDETGMPRWRVPVDAVELRMLADAAREGWRLTGAPSSKPYQWLRVSPEEKRQWATQQASQRGSTPAPARTPPTPAKAAPRPSPARKPASPPAYVLPAGTGAKVAASRAPGAPVAPSKVPATPARAQQSNTPAPDRRAELLALSPIGRAVLRAR